MKKVVIRRGDKRKRATDPIWSVDFYDIKHSITTPDQPVLYYLENGPKRAFVREELLTIPRDTENPPDFVLK